MRIKIHPGWDISLVQGTIHTHLYTYSQLRAANSFYRIILEAQRNFVLYYYATISFILYIGAVHSISA